MPDQLADSNDPIQVDPDYVWLVSAESAPFIADAQSSLQRSDELAIVIKRLRKMLSAQRANLVVETAKLRQRALAKFRRGDQMFFLKPSLEMATDELIGRFKARRFANFQNIADICCGIGGDLIGLASSVDVNQVVGFDNDPISVLFANMNLKAYGQDPVARLNDFNRLEAGNIETIHIDPQRRIDVRTTRGNRFSPSLDEIFEKFVGCSLAIKVAPATPVHEKFPQPVELQWIGHSRECKQQVVWCGDLMRYPNCRVATVIAQKETFEYSKEIGFVKNCPTNVAERIGKFVYEPHNTVIAAHLTDSMAVDFELKRISPGIAYLTGDCEIENGLLSRFEVLECMNADYKKVSAALRQYKFRSLEIKNRGVPDDLVKKFRAIRLSGEGDAATVLLVQYKKRMIAIIATRQ